MAPGCCREAASPAPCAPAGSLRRTRRLPLTWQYGRPVRTVRLLAAWQITNCGELMSERADARVNVTIAGTAGHVSLPGPRSEAWLTPARTSSRRPAGAGAMGVGGRGGRRAPRAAAA